MGIKNKASVVVGFLSILLLCFTACQNTSESVNQVKTEAPINHIVEISAMKFISDTVMVHPGDTVTFVNKDLVAHNATQLPDSIWQSPDLQEGESWSFVPTQSDSFFCSIHVVMKGYIMMMR